MEMKADTPGVRRVGVPHGPACADSGGQQMSQLTSLQHASRFFELRLESIGGLGAHAAGQVLATAGVLRMGLNGAHFSSYGSEKKGSLVRSFVRLGPADRQQCARRDA